MIFVCWSCCLIIFGLLLIGFWVVIVFFILGNYFLRLCNVFWNFSVFLVFFLSWFFLLFKFFSSWLYCLVIVFIFWFMWGILGDLGFIVDVSLLVVFFRLFILGFVVLRDDKRFLMVLSWFLFFLIIILVDLWEVSVFFVCFSSFFIGVKVLLYFFKVFFKVVRLFFSFGILVDKLLKCFLIFNFFFLIIYLFVL